MFGSGEENDPAASIAWLCDVGFGLTRMRCKGCVRLCNTTQNEEQALMKSRK